MQTRSCNWERVRLKHVRKQLHHVACIVESVLPQKQQYGAGASIILQNSKVHACTTLPAGCCVVFKLPLPHQVVLPFFSDLLVVFTFVARSLGSRGPRSRRSISLDVAHSQVRFHVSDWNLRIQNATLKVSV